MLDRPGEGERARKSDPSSLLEFKFTDLDEGVLNCTKMLGSEFEWERVIEPGRS